MTNEANPPVDSQTALQRLLDGNARYVAGTMQHPNQSAERRQEVAGGQQPIAAILACSDSRVAPEIVFDQGLGDLFVVRVAGNIVDDGGLGSLEYAVAHLHVPLVVVLGHSKCGAVAAAVAAVETGDDPPGHIGALVDAIRPAVKKAKSRYGDLAINAGQANVEGVVERLRGVRPILAEQVQMGRLRIVGGRYDLDSGQVEINVP